MSLSAAAVLPVARPDKPTTTPSTQPSLLIAHSPTKSVEHAPWLLYLPGVSGYRRMERSHIRGLVDSGLDIRTEVYDWTAYNPGLGALMNMVRNRAEAEIVAGLIKRAYSADSSRPIYLMAHSGGCGVAAWALEQLPAEMKVDQVVFLAPALSKEYDLTRCLEHVRGHLYNFSSVDDPVLGKMTTVFGTIDRVYTDSAGLGGFLRPDSATVAGYARLVPQPYRAEWSKYDNDGDHIGPLARPFAKAVLAPLLIPAR